MSIIWWFPYNCSSAYFATPFSTVVCCSSVVIIRMRQTIQLVGTGLLLASTVQAHPKPHTRHHKLSIPRTAQNASVPHANSFASFSFEPAFWVEFFGNASNPNALTFGLLDLIVEHGGSPIIRPGGITMDSMVSENSLDDSRRMLTERVDFRPIGRRPRSNHKSIWRSVSYHSRPGIL
jgi:hypothetical protein